MLFVFLLLFHPSAGADYDQSEPTQFLHKTPSRQLERLFTAGPFDREITLSFNTDSQEEEHNEIRRSVPEVRILRDRVIPLSQLSGQEKLIRFARSIGPSFDLPAYDFMVPAEKQENSSALAVLKFSTPDGGVTTFSVNMDRLKWFEIGGQVKRTQVGDRFEYEVPVLLAAGADVRPELTKNSVYKFNVEAKQGKETVSSRVRVEILSFSPTTRRVKATTTDAITSSVPTVETTTENARVEKAETGVTGVTRGDEALPTANTLDDHSVEGSAEPDRATSAEKSQNVPESTSTSVSSGEPSSSDQRSITEDQLLTTPTVQRPLEQKKMSVEVEGSGVPETKSLEKSSLSKSFEQDDDDPLSEVVTMAVPIQQKETIKGIDIDISGPTEGVFVIDRPLHRGDLIRGLVILATSKSEDTDWLSISIDRPELFSVRPKRIEPGGKAYLFSNHPHLIGDIRLKITISDGPVIEEVEIVIKHNKPKEDSISTKIDFSVKEDAPSGTIIGHIDHGNEMKIIGKAGLFALVGDDLLLSCSSEAPCLDYESQHLHYLLLAAKDGSAKTMKVTVTVIDLNDNAPYIEATDSMLRISDGQLTMPFAVQIVDEDSPSAQRNELSAAGDASDFLELEKVDVDLYQVRMKGSPAPGRFELVLRVDDGVHHSRKTHKTVKVLVQNSHSHAHFRRPRYERNILPEKILPGVEVVRVELEGLPIDEARFVVSRMNPGWLTIDDYGGTVSFTSPRRIPAVGQYNVIIAALSRETGRLLAQTTLSIKILGTPAVRRVFEKSVYEKTIDREASDVEFSLGVGSPVELDKSPLLAIDEDGLQGEISSEFVTVRGDKITVSKEAVPQLRVIRMDIISGQERATVLLHLTSSNEFLEHNRKMASKPLFPAFPDLLEVAEELPTGHVVATTPAVHPLTGELVPVRLEGGDGNFALDSHTGALKIASPMDYDKPGTVKEMMLTLHAGEEGYETVAKMKIRLVDVDDNPPNFSRDSLPEKIVIPENTPLDTVVMRVPVNDVDEISQERGLRLSLLGASRGLFKVMMANGTAIVQVAEELDREKDPQHVLQLVAKDSAGHKDAISVTIELSDVNDNSPVFSKELYDVQAVENWPAGLTLETLVATDADSMERGQVVYSLQSLNSKYFTINSTTGKFQIAQDLMGLARVEPYLLTAVATDRGSPPRNSTVRIRLSVTEPRKRNLAQLSFTSPPMDYILELKGELSPMDKIYQVKARLDGDGRNIKYSLKELLTETNKFSIDEMSGELMVKEQLKGKSEHITLRRGGLQSQRKSMAASALILVLPVEKECMDRLSRLLLPRRWRKRTPPAEDAAVEKLHKMVVVKNLQSMATAQAANSTESVVETRPPFPPPPELISEGLLRENRNSLRRRREDTWHGPPSEELPFIDCDVANEADLSSTPLGTLTTSSVTSSLPQLTRTGPELGSRAESGYLSALSLSPVSCERLTPRALRRARIRQTSQETINAKSEGYPSPPPPIGLNKRKAVSQLLPAEDDVDRFMRGWVYKTKYVTTVFEAKEGSLADLIDDATEEISRWLERRRMLVAATELHFSVPQEKRCRKDEQRLKTSLLSALVKNNQRILNLRRGRKLAPIQLVESRTEEKIERDSGCIQGVYLKAYGRLLRYSHWETPEWHSPYWKLPVSSTQPRPSAFMWSSDGDTTQQTALVAVNLIGLSLLNTTTDVLPSNSLLVTARHLHSLSGVEAVRILRVRYNPTTRADPFFPDGSPLYFPFKRLRPLGSIEAATEDGGEVFYYIIPSCSPHTALFALNSTSGELTHTGPESPKAVRVELCVIATTEPVTERANLRFDKEKRNNIVVEVVTEHDEHPLPDIHPLNNTVTTLDSNLSSLRLRMDDSALVSSFNFSIAQVSFIPSETVPPLATAAPLSSLFSITRGGIVRPSPSLSTQPSGVYTVQIDGQSAEVMQHLVQEFHLVPQTSRLRLVFDKQVVPVAKEYPAFEKEFKSTVTRSSEDAPRLVLDQPRVFHSNMSKASVCFHAVGQESLLSGATTISLLSKIADLYQVLFPFLSQSLPFPVYNKFGVVDIVANCDDPVVVEEPMSVALSSPASLFAASVLAFSLLFFFMIFVYFCFVRRYRDYLRAKEKSLKGPPQIVPSNPTFVLTPPQLVHQQSTAPLTYWE